MSEFIEFIKREHQKLLPRKKTTAELNDVDHLQHDSVASLTDLDEDGILTQSLQ